jgi:AraC-like DNA-binding protein
MQAAVHDSNSRSESLSDKLTRSRMFQDYQSAFESATGLPMHLHEVGSVQGGLSSRPGGNSFCLLMAKSNQACAACFALQQKIEQQAGMEPRSLHCFAGLCESAVPVRVGEKIIAFLQTGQILLHRPDAKQFTKVAQTLIEMGAEIDLKKAEEAWFATTVLKESQYQSMLRLLHIFAGHLSECANALSLEAQSAESASVTKAKVIVQATSDNEISLGRVARAVNVSASYFSELFHKTTGLTFTEYVARVRVEKVKNLLANHRLQITAIAYDTGFKSLSQFNRVFKRVCGLSPREYRLGLTGMDDS